MTAHLQGSDQRLFGENADVLLAQYVWNVGQFARADVVWIQGQSVNQLNN